ncbi:GlxA family transcriptional regulator [Pseudomonas sp. 21LCFQ010]|uniref:GlxA family transcriptional regulator n=1 Tax=Pseudomonas sp. 21LCFQ010 TaxID=2957506 RepID=UPI002097EC77|nr:GlxA family transcriptional regulator [Pseudomonas sp. 21LCFQ010]MCO8164439.1 GlxA family transcriptional regulator [Pseudomonas sp. 21LCFQ010]
MTAHRIGFLVWPGTKALTLALAEEALSVARQVHPEVSYERVVLHAETADAAADTPANAGDWRLPGQPWSAAGLEGLHKLFLLADEPPGPISAGLGSALKQLVRSGCMIGGLSAGVYPLAQLGLLDGYRAAVHWRWQDDFSERFPKAIATSHLFDWDRDRMTACGGLSVLDLLLAVLARDHGAELAGAVSEELVVERIREGGERQRIPLQNRLGSSHPKLTQAVLLMEANIEEPLTTDEIAQHVCVSRRQLERIFKQYLNRVPSQYYLELRLNKARQMLMQTSKSIIQIGLSCGFSSGPHFSSAYRNFFGATPREDRNQRRSNSPFELSSVPAERG